MSLLGDLGKFLNEVETLKREVVTTVTDGLTEAKGAVNDVVKEVDESRAELTETAKKAIKKTTGQNNTDQT